MLENGQYDRKKNVVVWIDKNNKTCGWRKHICHFYIICYKGM